ncbi:MAG: sigma 54-interacting transcriptional regulator [Myxococcota bacterium]|nr:sigma 54-interacting transcriptional regulator [Myxococcota bacterium]
MHTNRHRSALTEGANRLTSLDEIITGESPAIIELKLKLLRVAASDLPIIITGETGVGKDRVAHGIHRASSRHRGPFCAVNCGAVPKELIEAELFGTVPGAFTGATARKGWFERAHGGTLFLDEIGDMPLAAQASLLRVLEDGQVWAIGGQRPISVDCRIVAATHRHLSGSAQKGAFRHDLYYRLAVLTVHLPPLRERIEDLPKLVSALVPSSASALSPETLAALMNHSWPGNVRELRNVLLRSQVEAGDHPVEPAHLKFGVIPHGRGIRAEKARASIAIQPLDAVVQAHIKKALMITAGNVRAAARALRISPTTVYKYLGMSTKQRPQAIAEEHKSLTVSDLENNLPA